MKQVLFILFSFCIAAITYSQTTATLEIKIDGLRSSEGNLSITVFKDEKGFPEDADRAILTASIDLAKEKPVFIFKDIKPGTYAYAILHDEDKDNRMNKNMLGIPKEGFGFSNNYKPRIKNPSFNSASFALMPGLNSQKITIIYYL